MLVFVIIIGTPAFVFQLWSYLFDYLIHFFYVVLGLSHHHCPFVLVFEFLIFAGWLFMNWLLVIVPLLLKSSILLLELIYLGDYFLFQILGLIISFLIILHLFKTILEHLSQPEDLRFVFVIIVHLNVYI